MTVTLFELSALYDTDITNWMKARDGQTMTQVQHDLANKKQSTNDFERDGRIERTYSLIRIVREKRSTSDCEHILIQWNAHFVRPSIHITYRSDLSQ